ncbi:hypothetical protein AWC38_SpisGene15079 [Stylophora pistillata]|uniref:DDE Tnp4 domain-containing protein n=1 Tax=Stylophora pistillata TaxID=50429 RepID=A0A2B4RVW8_STYPI|nr:hypothetical protein AWC38_SpisGene15079 [Stylophora pistillata]
MPDNCCVPLCCKSGYRVGPDGGKITCHSLPTTDPRRLKDLHFLDQFFVLKIWLPQHLAYRETIDKAMPQSFKDKYPKTRVIIDGTEIKCQTPSSLVLHSETYSSYKSHAIFKGVIGIAPSGHITFISQLYAGSISDRELTVRSGLLNLPFSQGDVVMADKGFTISDLLEPIGVGLNIPPFLGLQSQQTPSEVIATQEIESERIQVERAINPKFLFNFCKWTLKPSISVLLGAAFAARYKEEMPGEVCPEVPPPPSPPPPDMCNLGFLKTMPINGSDEILFPPGLCHCWGREVQTKSSGIDLVFVDLE